MRDHKLPEIARDVMSWLKHWGIDKNFTLQNIDNIKNIFTSKFKDKLWCDKKSEDKGKLRYYKDVININHEYEHYLSVLTSVKKKIHIAKIRENSYELHC